jgi:hypothetical protein
MIPERITPDEFHQLTQEPPVEHDDDFLLEAIVAALFVETLDDEDDPPAWFEHTTPGLHLEPPIIPYTV